VSGDTKSVRQGDQIGRIFAYWAILFIGQLFENYRNSTFLGDTFPHGKRYLQNLAQNVLGFILGHFSQAHLVTLDMK
jgi:hypothetical protein